MMADASEKFTKLDVDGSGALDIGELGALWGGDVDEEKFRIELDLDNSGNIDILEVPICIGMVSV